MMAGNPRQAAHRVPASGGLSASREAAPGAVAALLIAGVADGLLAVACVQAILAWPIAILSHVALAALLCLKLARGADDRTAALLGGMAFSMMGPIGSVIAALQILLLGVERHGVRADGGWFRALSGQTDADPAEALYDAISEGRAYRPGTVPPRYAAVMDGGSVGARQDVLGQIVRRRQPFPPALLRKGLTSRDVAVRASAAAVHARLRETAKARADGEASR